MLVFQTQHIVDAVEHATALDRYFGEAQELGDSGELNQGLIQESHKVWRRPGAFG
jgi:hypothetical protein